MLTYRALTAGVKPSTTKKSGLHGSYTVAIHKRIVDAAKLGANTETIAQIACINVTTFRMWMIKAGYYEADPERYPTYEAYYRMRNEVQEAWGKTKLACLASILQAAQGRAARHDEKGQLLEEAQKADWRAAAFFLEKNDPSYARTKEEPHEDPVFDEDAPPPPEPSQEPTPAPISASADAAEVVRSLSPEQLRALAYGPKTDLKK